MMVGCTGCMCCDPDGWLSRRALQTLVFAWIPLEVLAKVLVSAYSAEINDLDVIPWCWSRYFGFGATCRSMSVDYFFYTYYVEVTVLVITVGMLTFWICKFHYWLYTLEKED